MSDPTDEILRRALTSLPQPHCAPDLAAEVSRRIAARVPEAREGVAARLVLAAYWLLAVIASAWICRGLSWPGWSSMALWAGACALVPLGYAVVLWPRGTVLWTRLILAPLIGALPAERRS